jgi:hypothetical protein
MSAIDSAVSDTSMETIVDIRKYKFIPCGWWVKYIYHRSV